MKHTDAITPRQFAVTAFVAVLSPLIRRFPRVLAETAGRSAWLSAPLTAPPAAAAILLLWLLWRRRSAPTGYGALLRDVLGEAAGRIVTGLYALWLIFYVGFLLRSGAGRFVSTVYPGAGPGVFIVVFALVCLPAALGRVQTLARTAMLCYPLLLAALAAAMALTLRDLDFSALLPVTRADLIPNGRAALQTVNVLAAAFYLAFAGGQLTRPLRLRDYAGRCALLLLLIGLMCACCIAMFGPELTAKLTYPFFMLVRDVAALGPLERAEPLVIALWVFPDFVFVSLLLHIASDALREALGYGGGAGKTLSDLSHGRWLTLPCAAGAAAVGLTVAPELQRFTLLSDQIVPLGNAVMVFALPLLVLLVGALRRKI